MDNEIVLYQRERSSMWQCRLKLDGKWQRTTTKTHKLAEAKRIAFGLRMEAEIRKKSNLPAITRNFRHVAKVVVDQLDKDMKAGHGKVSYADYKRVIERYLIPFFGSYSIANIDYAALERFDAWRTKEMKKAPTQSTVLTHNAALNRIFDEAVFRGYLSETTRPKLDAKGKQGERRPAFELHEIHKLFTSFETWIPKAVNAKSKELRMLLRDYVAVLLDTGARPGKELLELRWNQILYEMKPQSQLVDKPYLEDPDEPPDDPYQDYPEPMKPIPPDKVISTDLSRNCFMTVSGKTGEREILGNEPTIKALVLLIPSEI